MDRENFQRLEELFHAIVDLGEAEQRRRLAELRADDPDLAARLERMLARDSTPTVGEDVAREELRALPSGTLELPTTIGAFRLTRLLGEGGMGIVYEAIQEHPFRRRVALKLIRHGLGDETVIARFRLESQALALMDHPNIARVFDAGTTEDGRPFFVMELVEGLPITDYCDQQRLSMTARLRLFLDVCDAVQHAHRRGVLHRDLKPSNLLVQIDDGSPRVKVIDFGIARALDHAELERDRFTRFGEMVGTPEYMSPEQASGQALDTRSDVYSLGVVLHELLVGELPLPGAVLRSAGFDEIRRQILEYETPRPSTRVDTGERPTWEIASLRSTEPAALLRELRGDLDWIVLKALAKEADRRYESPLELGSDLERHLAGEPAEAGPPDLRYRLGKLVRRHRVAAGVAAVVGLALCVALAGLSVGLVRARTAEREAQEARIEAERQAAVSATVLQFLQDDVLAAANPEEGGSATLTVGEALDLAAATIDQRFADRPGQRGSIHSSIGLAYGALGRFEEAAAHLSRAIDALRQEPGPDHPDTVRALGNLGELYRKQGRLQEAEPLLLEALERKRVLLDASDESLGISINNLGLMYRDMGRPDDAEPLLVESLELARRHEGEDSVAALTGVHNLALLYQDQGRLDDAVSMLERNLEAWRRVLGEDHAFTLQATHVLANAYADANRLDDAVALLRDLVPRRSQALGDDHPGTLASKGSLAEALTGLGELDEAERLFVETLDGARRTMPDHWLTATLLGAWGRCLTALGRWDEAEAVLLESHDRLQSTFAGSDPRVARVREGMAALYEAWERPDDASRWREPFSDP